MKRTFLLMISILSCLSMVAQERNCVFPITVNDLNYAVAEKKVSAGQILGAVLEAAAGTSTTTDHREFTQAVSDAVRQAITNVRRLTPVAEGGVFDLSGNITSLTSSTSARTSDRTDSKGKKYTTVQNIYQASVAITLTLTDCATGQQSINAFSGCNSIWDCPLSETEAIKMAIDNMVKEIVQTYDNMFPLTAEIVKAGEAKKDKQKEVFINLGLNQAVVKGMKLDVLEVGEVAGCETRKKIGRLKVEEVLGDEISRCKVDKGDKEIKRALDENATLQVITVK